MQYTPSKPELKVFSTKASELGLKLSCLSSSSIQGSESCKQIGVGLGRTCFFHRKVMDLDGGGGAKVILSQKRRSFG